MPECAGPASSGSESAVVRKGCQTGQGCALSAHLLQPLEVGKRVQPVHKGLTDVVHFFVKMAVEGLDQIEFPLRGVKVRGCEDAAGQAVFVRRVMPAAHPLPEGAERRQRRLQAFQYMVRQLAVLFGIFFYAVKDRRLDVCNDEAVKIVKKAALNDFARKAHFFFFGHVERVFMPKHAGQQHLVRLLVDFKQLRRAQLVVPAQQICARKNELKQAFANICHIFSGNMTEKHLAV